MIEPAAPFGLAGGGGWILVLAMPIRTGGSQLVTKRDVLEELSLPKLKKIARQLGIQIPQSVGGFLARTGLGIELRRPYIEALASSQIATLEEIDRILGTDFSGTGVGRREAPAAPRRPSRDEEGAAEETPEEAAEEEGPTLLYVLKKYFYKDELQDLCDELDLPVSGSKEDLIERIVNHDDFAPGLVTSRLDKDQLKTLCEEMELRTSGTRDDLERRVLDALAAESPEPAQTKAALEPARGEPLAGSRQPSYPHPEDTPQPARSTAKREFFAPQDTFSQPPLEFPEVPPPTLIPETTAPQIAQLQMVSEFLDAYRPSQRFRNEQAYEIEIAQAMRHHFGAENVKTQANIVGGRIDIEVMGIGVEIKVPTSRSQLQTLLGQLSIYRNHYGSNVMVLVFNDFAKVQDVNEFCNILRGRGIQVFVK